MTVDTAPAAPLTADVVRAVLDRLVGRQGWSLTGELHPIGGGRSALTLAGRLNRPGRPSAEVVVRAERHGQGRLSLVSTPDHGALLEAVRAHGIRAPRPLLAEDVPLDGGSLGLLVTERIEGAIPNPWRSSGRRALADLRQDEGFLRDFVEQLVRIHEVPIRDLPPGLVGHAHPDPAASYEERVAARAAEAVAASPHLSEDPVFAHAIRWAAQPPVTARRHAGLVHGDYRMGNVVVREGRVAGILDWELAEIGDTISDVGWLHGAQARTDGLVGGLFEGTELVAAYERASGRVLDAALVQRHAALGTVRTASVWVALSPWRSLRDADPAALRAVLSTVQSKPLLWAATRPGEGGASVPPPATAEPASSPHRRLLDRGLAAFASLLARALATPGEETLLARTVRHFLAAQADLLTSVDWPLYEQAVTALGPGPWPGAILTRHLRAGGAALADGTVAALALAARPGPALADVLSALAAAQAGDHDGRAR